MDMELLLFLIHPFILELLLNSTSYTWDIYFGILIFGIIGYLTIGNEFNRLLDNPLIKTIRTFGMGLMGVLLSKLCSYIMGDLFGLSIGWTVFISWILVPICMMLTMFGCGLIDYLTEFDDTIIIGTYQKYIDQLKEKKIITTEEIEDIKYYCISGVFCIIGTIFFLSTFIAEDETSDIEDKMIFITSISLFLFVFSLIVFKNPVEIREQLIEMKKKDDEEREERRRQEKEERAKFKREYKDKLELSIRANLNSIEWTEEDIKLFEYEDFNKTRPLLNDIIKGLGKIIDKTNINYTYTYIVMCAGEETKKFGKIKEVKDYIQDKQNVRIYRTKGRYMKEINRKETEHIYKTDLDVRGMKYYEDTYNDGSVKSSYFRGPYLTLIKPATTYKNEYNKKMVGRVWKKYDVDTLYDVEQGKIEYNVTRESFVQQITFENNFTIVIDPLLKLSWKDHFFENGYLP